MMIRHPEQQEGHLAAGRVAVTAGRLLQLWPGARVAELADALDLGSSGATHGGSSPPSRTIIGPIAGQPAGSRVLICELEWVSSHF